MSLGWYPIINDKLCTGCELCYEFCPHGVYKWDKLKENPVVTHPEKCIQGCHGCEAKCSAKAIRYFGDLPGRQSDGVYRIKF